jgi:hypothetical protein
LNADLLTILNNDPTLIAISGLIDTVESSNVDLSSQLNIERTHNADLTTLVNSLITEVADKDLSIATLSNQLNQAPLHALSNITAYTQLHKWPAKTTDNKEVLGVWIDSGGHTAQTAPSTNTTPHGTFTWTSGTDISPTRLNFIPGAGWDNIFIYERFPLPQALPGIVIDRRTFSFNPTDRPLANAVEWQQEFKWNGFVFNCGWQWNFSSKLFRIFDYNAKSWKATSVPFTDLGSTPINVMTKHILDGTKNTTTHVSITINGTEYPVNVTQPATPTTIGNKYTVSLLQLDSNKNGDLFGINIHDAAALYL